MKADRGIPAEATSPRLSRGGEPGPAALTRALVRIACALLTAVMLCLALASLVSTSRIDPGKLASEVIFYSRDNAVLNAAVLLFVLFAATAAARYLPPPSERAARIACALALLWTAASGAVAVCASRSIPFSDSACVVDAGAAVIRGDMAAIGGIYFQNFPFQLHAAFLFELLQRVFGAGNYLALALVNVAALTLAYAAVLRLAKRLFSDARVTLLTAVFLALYVQGAFYCVFLYGTLIGLAAALWAADCCVAYLQGGKKRLLVPAVLLIALAILCKPNYWILAVALCIVLLLHLLREKRWWNLAAIACIALVPVLCGSLILRRDARLSGASYDGGVPQSVWLSMGLRAGYMAPGWYNSYTRNLTGDGAYDPATMDAQVQADIAERLSFFSQNPLALVKFMGQKLLSQWNEPSYESVWLGQVRQHARPVPAWLQSVYTGTAGEALFAYFNQYVQALFCAAALGLGLLAGSGMSKKRRLRPAAPDPLAAALLPIAVLGGVLYHMLFEAKSQYIFIYLPMLAPFAAAGLAALSARAAACLHARKPQKGEVTAV